MVPNQNGTYRSSHSHCRSQHDVSVCGPGCVRAILAHGPWSVHKVRRFYYSRAANWWARDGGCSLVTPSPAYGFGGKNAVQIHFNIMATPPVHDRQWQTAVLQRLEREGRPPRRVTDLTVAGRETICFERGGASPEISSTISCNVDEQMESTCSTTIPNGYQSNTRYCAAFDRKDHRRLLIFRSGHASPRVLLAGRPLRQILALADIEGSTLPKHQSIHALAHVAQVGFIAAL